MNRLPVLLLLLLCAAGPGSAQVLPATLDLATCRRLALEHNPSLQAARERIVEQDGVREERAAGRHPQLDATADYTVIDPGRVEDFGGAAVDDTSWNAGVEASLSLYSGNRLVPYIRSAERTREALGARAETARQDILLALHEQFYGAMLARERIGVQEESIALLGEQLGLASNRYAAGAGPKFDVLQAEVALANARPVLLRARNTYRIQVEQLRRVIGLPYPAGAGPDDTRIDGAWQGDLPVPGLEAALQAAAAGRPEIADLAQQRRAGEQDLLVARRGLRPRLEAFAGYGFLNDRFSADSDYLDGWVAGLRARWPLWDGRATRGAVRQQGSRLLQLDLQAADLALAIGEEVRRYRYDCEVAQRILASSGLVITQAEEALRLARNRFQAGGATQLDVLQSQLELTRARLEEANAQHDLHVAHVRLRRALGGL